MNLYGVSTHWKIIFLYFIAHLSIHCVYFHHKEVSKTLFPVLCTVYDFWINREAEICEIFLLATAGLSFRVCSLSLSLLSTFLESMPKHQITTKIPSIDPMLCSVAIYNWLVQNRLNLYIPLDAKNLAVDL